MKHVESLTPENLCAGGLYAEMVQNRAFEEPVNTATNLSDFHAFHPVFMDEEDLYIRHCDFQGMASKVLSDLDKHDSSFAIRSPGLAGGATVSLESLNYPTFYLRQEVLYVAM